MEARTWFGSMCANTAEALHALLCYGCADMQRSRRVRRCAQCAFSLRAGGWRRPRTALAKVLVLVVVCTPALALRCLGVVGGCVRYCQAQAEDKCCCAHGRVRSQVTGKRSRRSQRTQRRVRRSPPPAAAAHVLTPPRRTFLCDLFFCRETYSIRLELYSNTTRVRVASSVLHVHVHVHVMYMYV